MTELTFASDACNRSRYNFPFAELTLADSAYAVERVAGATSIAVKSDSLNQVPPGSRCRCDVQRDGPTHCASAWLATTSRQRGSIAPWPCRIPSLSSNCHTVAFSIKKRRPEPLIRTPV